MNCPICDKAIRVYLSRLTPSGHCKCPDEFQEDYLDMVNELNYDFDIKITEIKYLGPCKDPYEEWKREKDTPRRKCDE
jgi:hypothetical protein